MLALNSAGAALTSRSMSMVFPTPTPPYMYRPEGTSAAGVAGLPQPCHLTAHCQRWIRLAAPERQSACTMVAEMRLPTRHSLSAPHGGRLICGHAKWCTIAGSHKGSTCCFSWAG